MVVEQDHMLTLREAAINRLSDFDLILEEVSVWDSWIILSSRVQFTWDIIFALSKRVYSG